jgi:hypothetical protein
LRADSLFGEDGLRATSVQAAKSRECGEMPSRVGAGKIRAARGTGGGPALAARPGRALLAADARGWTLAIVGVSLLGPLHYSQPLQASFPNRYW